MRKKNLINSFSISIPVEFFLAISSALDVFLCSILKFGMLNGGTCMLSELIWCLNGLCRSGLGNDKLSNFNLFLWFLWKYHPVGIFSINYFLRIVFLRKYFHFFFCYLSMWSSISCNTSNNIVNWSRLSEGLTVCGKSDGITLVAIKLTESPYFLSLNISL